MRKELNIENPKRSKDIMEDDYVNKTVEAYKSKSGFKLLAWESVPFKTLVGVADQELVPGISRKWKQKFKTDFGHNIIEDEEVLKR